MRHSEIRLLQREKWGAEHTGMGLTADSYLVEPPLTEIQVSTLKDEVRNETAKALAKNLEFSWTADSIKSVFYSECDAFSKGLITEKTLLGMYQRALNELKKLTYAE